MRISKAELTCRIVDIFLLILIIAGYVTGNGNTGLTLMILSNVVVRRIACIPEKKSIRILINAAGIALLTAGGMIWGIETLKTPGAYRWLDIMILAIIVIFWLVGQQYLIPVLISSAEWSNACSYFHPLPS